MEELAVLLEEPLNIVSDISRVMFDQELLFVPVDSEMWMFGVFFAEFLQECCVGGVSGS